VGVQKWGGDPPRGEEKFGNRLESGVSTFVKTERRESSSDNTHSAKCERVTSDRQAQLGRMRHGAGL
jgi:hypothetical protein